MSFFKSREKITEFLFNRKHLLQDIISLLLRLEYRACFSSLLIDTPSNNNKTRKSKIYS